MGKVRDAHYVKLKRYWYNLENVMPNYRRLKTPGATYFFTVVTFKRQMIFCDSLSLKLLRNAIEEVKKLLPFRLNVWVLLPDHMHCLWTLPEGDYDYSKRWGKIKSTFTKEMKAKIS